MPVPLHLLIIEDSADDAELILAELRRAGFEPRWKRVECKEDFLAELKNAPDIVLSDYSLPQFDGLRAAELLREQAPDIPFILISGTVGEEMAVEAMKHGATDYLLKDRLTRLGSAVTQALEQRRLRLERRQAEEKIKSQLRELQRWHAALLGREDRVQSLKREVNELLRLAGKPPRYADDHTEFMPPKP
jgi:DNA-binding NtrC family response regulator